MYNLILGIVLVVAGIYLLIKGIVVRKTGEVIEAELVSFVDDRNTHYPMFKFNYDGEELKISGSQPARNPDKYKHNIGDRVEVIFRPGHKDYVDVKGEYMDIVYGALSFILGALLTFSALFK